jgi:hypothetical protein
MSGERFGDGERALLAGLADVMIPASPALPSASEAGVAGRGLDLVLAARPDLAEGLKRVLDGARGQDPAAVIAGLAARDPAGFDVLAEVVPGAYFMDPRVRAAIGYGGQGPRPIDPAEEIDAELLASVIARGPIYRPTPGRERG